MNQTFYGKLAQSVAGALDTFASGMLQAEKTSRIRKRHGDRPARSRILAPEEDVRNLLTTAQNLDDLWTFFTRRLNSGSDLDLMCFSILDESGDFIRLKHLYPKSPEKPFDAPIISMSDRDNHLVQAYTRRDTTFTSRLRELGAHICPYFDIAQPLENNLNCFSIPFIADNKAIAMMTLGFAEVDAFSQAKLSYLYTLRDQIAQLVWNLTLRERMKSQAQIDTLTGLLTHTYFQRLLETELEKALENDTAVTTMILDINNIQDINQEQGHIAGDNAICHLASTVRRLIRGIDTVARYGGDEIIVILPETDPQAADEMAERFLKGLQDRPLKNGQPISASIGYATFPHDTRHKDMLLKYTEQALHLAKFKGGKTDVPTKVAYHEAKRLNDKTVLEVFASHVARKYDNHRIFEELLSVMEQKEGGNNPATTSSSPEHLMLETIGSLAGALDAKDKYTRGHSQAVANYAVALAHALQLPPDEVEQVRLAAFLHDIGKIGIPETILCKRGPLNEREWEIMKQHPVIGARQILAPVTALREVIPMVEHHHENWDGTGYPAGLSGDNIPLGARIVSIVDAFHGLTSDRSYRKALPITEAAAILEQGAHTKWDPHLIGIFLKILNIATPQTETAEASPPKPNDTLEVKAS